MELGGIRLRDVEEDGEAWTVVQTDDQSGRRERAAEQAAADDEGVRLACSDGCVERDLQLRPSGGTASLRQAPPPFWRAAAPAPQSSVSGVVWIGLAAFLFTIAVLVVAYATLGYSFDRWNSLFLQRLSALRIGWLDHVMIRVDDVLSSRWTVGILRLGTMFALIVFGRWRHLLVFLASIMIVEALTYELAIFVASPRPHGVRIIERGVAPSV